MAAHRTGPSDFFRNLDKLNTGSLLYVVYENISYKYQVEYVRIIEKNDWSEVKPLSHAAITLTTCQAEGRVSNAKRLVVRGKMVGMGNVS
jgi:LPXTG-site transpeptidase (sortase) family protein